VLYELLTQRPEVLIAYVRQQNKRGDTCHPVRRLVWLVVKGLSWRRPANSRRFCTRHLTFRYGTKRKKMMRRLLENPWTFAIRFGFHLIATRDT
jgi:hypothetical protein